MTELETLQRKLTDLEMETLSACGTRPLRTSKPKWTPGTSDTAPPVRRLRKEASEAARTEAIALILGETGTRQDR